MIAFVKWMACLFHFINTAHTYNGLNIIYIEENPPQSQTIVVFALLVRKEACFFSS